MCSEMETGGVRSIALTTEALGMAKYPLSCFFICSSFHALCVSCLLMNECIKIRI